LEADDGERSDGLDDSIGNREFRDEGESSEPMRLGREDSDG
jgi:hypothetical protein